MKWLITSLLTVSLLASGATAFGTNTSSKNQQKGDMPTKIGGGTKTFIFNPRTLNWAAYDGSGTRVAVGRGNGGAHYCADVKRRCHSPTGTFRLQSKGSAGCKSTRYPIKRVNGRIVRGGANMPYCMYFTSNYAIHGYAHIGSGNVSHGCIRVTNSAAQFLHGFLPVGSRVIIRSY